MDEPDKPAIGRRLVEAFANRGITSKKAIGKALGYESENAIYKVISGERELSFDGLIRFVQATGRSIDWLLTGADPPFVDGNPLNEQQVNEGHPGINDENPAELRELLRRFFSRQEMIAAFDSASPRVQAQLAAIVKGFAFPESIPVARAVGSGTKTHKKAS